MHICECRLIARFHDDLPDRVDNAFRLFQVYAMARIGQMNRLAARGTLREPVVTALPCLLRSGPSFRADRHGLKRLAAGQNDQRQIAGIDFHMPRIIMAAIRRSR